MAFSNVISDNPKPVGSLTLKTEAPTFLLPAGPLPSHRLIHRSLRHLHEMLVHMTQYFSTLLLFKCLLTCPWPKVIGTSPLHRLHCSLLLLVLALAFSSPFLMVSPLLVAKHQPVPELRNSLSLSSAANLYII